MMLETIMKALVFLAIAVPFFYIFIDVTVDILRRFLGFYKRTKPVMISLFATFAKF